MCRSTTEPGGPRRCSGDTRAAYGQSCHAVAVLEQEEAALKDMLAESDHTVFNDMPAGAGGGGGGGGGVGAPALERVSFGDKETRVEDIRREIDAAVANLNTAEKWTKFLETASQFHDYSMQNQLLILMQRPDATYVGGLRKVWNAKFNRSLIPGSKAIWVKAPVFRKRDKPDGTQEEVLTGFTPVPVYDISDTVGPPLPERPKVDFSREKGDAPPGMHADLTKQVNDHGFIVEYRELPADGPEGWTQTQPDKRVVISTRYSTSHQGKVLAHELAHIELGHTERHHEYHNGPDGQRPTMEVEAESVAYVIGRHYGLSPGSYAFAYIDGWAKGDAEKVRETGERVTKACKSILGRLPQPTPETVNDGKDRTPRARTTAATRRRTRR